MIPLHKYSYPYHFFYIYTFTKLCDHSIFALSIWCMEYRLTWGGGSNLKQFNTRQQHNKMWKKWRGMNTFARHCRWESLSDDCYRGTDDVINCNGHSDWSTNISPSVLFSLHRLSTNTGSVPSSSIPHRCTAATGSPAGSTAWKSSRGVPSYYLTMMSSFMEEAPVLYAQVGTLTFSDTNKSPVVSSSWKDWIISCDWNQCQLLHCLVS